MSLWLIITLNCNTYCSISFNSNYFSLCWILNNHQDQVEKSLIDIKEYVESMGKTLQGSDNAGYQEGRAHIQMEDISLDDDEETKKKPDLSVNPETSGRKKWINWFNVKMILIGSTAMTFARINGNDS